MTAISSAQEMEMARKQLQAKVRTVADFPQKGILFRDITPVLQDAASLQLALRLHLAHIADLRKDVDCIVGIESRGFLFGMALAHQLKVGFVPVRKPGKLPSKTVECSYALEYGQDRLQIHADAISSAQRVVIVDDLLATGGTAEATVKLVEQLGGIVCACLFFMELTPFKGRTRLGKYRVETVLPCT